MRSLTSLLLLSFAVAACGAGAPPAEMSAPSSRSGSLDSTNGRSLNGRSLNGRSINGRSLNGRSLNGVTLNGRSLNGRSLNGVSLNGSQLLGVSSDGQPLAGPQLEGVVFDGILDDGSTLPIRIDDVSTGTDGNADVWFYDVSYQTDAGFQPLCGYEDNGDPVAAIALAGTWDYSEGTKTGGSWIPSSTVFTFGCRHVALAKCVEMGYKPWSTYQGESLRKYHQACTRLLRADYCGNGKSWTLDGRNINLYDALGVQKDTERWTFEAEWTDTGARCMSSMRVVDLQNVFGVVDQCVLNKALSLGCGSTWHFASGTLLMNEYRDLNLLGIINL